MNNFIPFAKYAQRYAIPHKCQKPHDGSMMVKISIVPDGITSQEPTKVYVSNTTTIREIMQELCLPMHVTDKYLLNGVTYKADATVLPLNSFKIIRNGQGTASLPPVPPPPAPPAPPPPPKPVQPAEPVERKIKVSIAYPVISSTVANSYTDYMVSSELSIYDNLTALHHTKMKGDMYIVNGVHRPPNYIMSAGDKLVVRANHPSFKSTEPNLGVNGDCSKVNNPQVAALKEIPMSINLSNPLVKQTLVYGSNVDTMNQDQLLDTLKRLEKHGNELTAIKPKSKAVAAQIKNIKTATDEVIAKLDEDFADS